MKHQSKVIVMVGFYEEPEGEEDGYVKTLTPCDSISMCESVEVETFTLEEFRTQVDQLLKYPGISC